MNNDEIIEENAMKLTRDWNSFEQTKLHLEYMLNEARADQERIDKIFWTQTVQNERSLGKIIERERADQKRKDIEKLEKAMPYPEDVFIPRSKAEIKLVVELIKKNNLSPDGIFGEYMRRSWQNAIAKLKED